MRRRKDLDLGMGIRITQRTRKGRGGEDTEEGPPRGRPLHGARGRGNPRPYKVWYGLFVRATVMSLLR